MLAPFDARCRASAAPRPREALVMIANLFSSGLDMAMNFEFGNRNLDLSGVDEAALNRVASQYSLDQR